SLPIAPSMRNSSVPRTGFAQDPEEAEKPARPYLRLWFECSKQYARAHRLPDGSAYVGRCPTCGASVRFTVGPEGTAERFFRLGSSSGPTESRSRPHAAACTLSVHAPIGIVSVFHRLSHTHLLCNRRGVVRG